MKRPMIRFPEYKDDWGHKELDDFLSLSLRPVSKPKTKYLAIGIRSHFKGTFQKPNTDPEKNVMDTLYSVKENNLLVNITFAWEGALSIVPKKDEGGLVSHRFPTYIFDETKVSHTFFQYSFFRNKFKHELGIISPGGAGRNRVLNKTDFLKLKCLFPTLPEQKRIANFFFVLDNKINELKGKKSLLEEYKKGVMQKIFSQELRFKDGNGVDFPEWKEKKLKEVSTITMGHSPSSNSYNSNGAGRYLIQGNADISNRKTNPRNWTTEPTKLCEIGDLILTVRAPVGAIAKSNHNACIGRGVCSIKNNSKSNIEFLYQFFLDFGKKWIQLEQGSTFTAVSGKDIKSIKINLPCLVEQNKIANFLSKIDDKINVVNVQIEKTQEYKNWILQRMFV